MLINNPTTSYFVLQLKISLQKYMKVEKIIKIIESCESYIHFENTKAIIDEITFDSQQQCEEVKAAIIKKEKQFNNHIL